MIDVKEQRHEKGAFMNVVETRGLAKSYRGKRAVDRFDMHVAQGDIYGFVGKNGAGKSTVMKMVCGPGDAHRGRDRAVRQCGRRRMRSGSVEGAPRIGALIEAPGLVRQPVRLREPHGEGACHGRGRRALHAAARRLRSSGWTARARRRRTGFSLGMKQRLGLALALDGLARPAAAGRAAERPGPRGHARHAQPHRAAERDAAA